MKSQNGQGTDFKFLPDSKIIGLKYETLGRKASELSAK
jgi:hypothetical protein